MAPDAVAVDLPFVIATVTTTTFGQQLQPAQGSDRPGHPTQISPECVTPIQSHLTGKVSQVNRSLTWPSQQSPCTVSTEGCLLIICFNMIAPLLAPLVQALEWVSSNAAGFQQPQNHTGSTAAGHLAAAAAAAGTEHQHTAGAAAAPGAGSAAACEAQGADTPGQVTVFNTHKLIRDYKAKGRHK